MTKINSLYQKAVRIQFVVCGLLFSLFSFVYLFVFQRDVLEALHFSLAHGNTHFNPLGSVLVIMLTLLILAWGVNYIVRFQGKFHALAYIPSFFVLMAMSDIGRDVYMNGGNTMWQWLLPTLVGGFTGISFLCKHLFQVNQDTDVTVTQLLNYNLVTLLVGSVVTVCVGASNASLHHELEIERHLREKNYNEALKVGERSLETTRTLTALRALALSHTGQLGDKLFTYPQYFGADGLFLPEDSLQILRYTNDSIYNFLGARPYSGGNRLIYLSNLCYDERGNFTALDYYLTALLLEKRIDSFAEAVVAFYEPEDSLATHYREAILMYQTIHPDFAYAVKDSSFINKYSIYTNRKTEFRSKTEEKNRMRREYGDTYWWYYDYQE